MIEIPKGRTVVLNFALDSPIGGGATLTFIARRDRNDTTPLLTKTTDITYDAQTMTGSVKLVNADTATFPLGEIVFAVVANSAPGEDSSIAEGKEGVAQVVNPIG